MASGNDGGEAIVAQIIVRTSKHPVDSCRMGIDFVLSLRSSSKHDAFAFSVHRAFPGSPCLRGARLAGGLRRRRSQAIAAGGGYQPSTFAHNGDGSCVWRAPNSILHREANCHLHSRHCDQHVHHHHHHCCTGASADVSCHSRLGFAASNSGHTLDVDEHVCCEILFSHNCNRHPSVDWEKSKVNISRARGTVSGVGVPLSLRMLKKKQQDLGKAALTSGLVEVGNSLLKAFSSMVFMMKELQSHCLHVQRQFFKQEIEGLLGQVHREMHASFVWLFQQVFSCTPELMVLLMVMLADFTAFSMASSMPMGMTMSAVGASLATDVPGLTSHISGSDKSIQVFLKSPTIYSPSLMDHADQMLDDNGGWIGNGGKWTHRGYSAAGNGDHEFDTSEVLSSVNKQFDSVVDNLPPEMSSLRKAALPMKEGFESEASNRQILLEDELSYEAAALAYEQLNTEEESVSGSFSSGSDKNLQRLCESHPAGLSDSSPLNHTATQNFLMPFTASVEDDSYTCYDRTDLAYQFAISSDATNSMLLANYAQFLFLVRRDHDRAEELFRRAVQCDPLDSDAISRFARFLWLARCNLSAAGKAYQAAVRADPCNSFHAADYAHFLWNSGQ